MSNSGKAYLGDVALFEDEGDPIFIDDTGKEYYEADCHIFTANGNTVNLPCRGLPIFVAVNGVDATPTTLTTRTFEHEEIGVDGVATTTSAEVEVTAISVNNQINYLYKVKTDDLYKYDDHIKGISSYDFNHLIKHGVKKKHITKEKIESISITKLFEKYDFNIDLLFIDAEGYDAEIAIDLLQKSNFRPIIIIEYVHIKLPSIKILNNLFIDKKYKYFKIRENLICIPNERLVIINI